MLKNRLRALEDLTKPPNSQEMRKAPNLLCWDKAIRFGLLVQNFMLDSGIYNLYTPRFPELKE
jgi:hypothetical protein